MSIFTAENLHLAFGPKPILDAAGFMVSAGERIGVVGPNGTGKSTLFRIIIGAQELDGGRLHFARGVSVGYLPQDILEVGRAPLLQSVLEAVPGKADLETRLTDSEAALHESEDADEQMELAQRIADLHVHLDQFEAEYSEYEAERILMGLGFKTADFRRSLSEFSGGWKMRAALAGLLFKRPDLLLLDEPTNHLDIPSVNWLNEFLLSFRNAIMLISHDGEFLNKQVKRILSFEVEGLRSYPGDYNRYRELRDHEIDVRRAARKNQDAEIRQARHFIRRFRAKASKARQVQSRIKQLEKMEIVEVDHGRQELRFSFPPSERIGKIAVHVENVTQRFGELVLYDGLDAAVSRGDRIALIGYNGAGKTTLLRIMAGDLTPTAGTVECGSNVKLSYYAQHRLDRLDRSRTVLDEVWRVSPSLSQTAVRTICGAFLFSGGDVDKSVSVLSGGELARVSLAQLLVNPGNVLLMDEPTNHLDLLSTEALAETLETFDGTLVFVSHNQAFINRIANKVWDLENGELRVYPGNLADYRYHLSVQEEKENERAERAKSSLEAAPSDADSVPDNKQRHEQRKRINRERTRLERLQREAEDKAAELENRIAKMEARQAELEAKLADPGTYEDPDRYNKLLAEYEEIKGKITELTGRWEHQLKSADKASAKLDRLPTV
ncbi:MAG: ATP-binding cassette domain-containing protein [Candidatus Lernaella stagnicola]|nr:ATP-binding cassette domain-containing protein [Candidatus Lernaella stagnicola]